MSFQTKDQALGYILVSAFNYGLGKNDLKKLKVCSFKILEVLNTEKKYCFTNWDTSKVLITACKKQKWDDERISLIDSNLYWAFDDSTVEESQGYYESFIKLGT